MGAHVFTYVWTVTKKETQEMLLQLGIIVKPCNSSTLEVELGV